MGELVPPTERVCERCGRREVWDGRRGTWTADGGDGDRAVGTPHCLHEWDINGTYSPIRE